ncbi:hypothetical protein CHS0354_016672 [Potamilus streckersoni]|uniref:RING-type E3 ubiquitin transferase n=1 Tax=Potamilus streckersoni TaxID=2493646 RepID=A0AAE0THL7_9BIVA|nr:hypothetical protein CHS0354_016672 [Potamilus streckersoni]
MADNGAGSNSGKVPTGCFCEKSSEGIHSTESHMSSEIKVDGTLREASTRDKENENIYISPTIDKLIHKRNGMCLVKLVEGKTYPLPFTLATKPQFIYSEGFYCIMHDDVWYKLKQSCQDYLLLQNMQTKKYIKIYEYSESMHGTRKRNEKRTNSRSASHNECKVSLDSQTVAESSSRAMEGIRNSSIDTAQRAEGGRVTKTDKMGDERTEINRGETHERDNEEKPVDEAEDKTRTARTISSGGNTLKGLEAEIDTNIDQTQNRDPVQRFKGEFSRGETNNLSGDTDKTKEDKNQASNEEVIQSKERSTSFRPLKKTEKTPKKETLVEDFCEIEGIDTDENFGGTGDISEGNESNISSSSASATETTSDMATEDPTPIPPPRTKRMKSSARKNGGLHEGVENAKEEKPGVQQRDWSYSNDKKITLLKAASCDADVIIIPGDSDKDSQSHFGDKKLMRFKVPDGTEKKAMTVLQQEIKQVLDRISEKIVGICIKAMEGWNFLCYLKCFLNEILNCFMRKEGKPCPIEHVILLVDDGSDYSNAIKIIQKRFKLEQDKSEIVERQKLLLQEQGSVFKRIRVKVINGQLHEAQVEVLVNTVHRSLDLTKGVISSSLLNKAGKEIQSELLQYQENFEFGEVLKTGAGTLPKPCMAIFHGVLYSYEAHSDCLKVFKDFLAGCLKDANKKYRSIAFPPIGTGKLRYPKDLVASLMFQSVANFEQAHLTSKLEEVIFVIYEKDQEVLKVFEEMFRRCVETKVADKLVAVPAVSGVSRMLLYGQVQVQAKHGDFKNENQNCLLVLWEKQCLYNISEKNSILHLAGSTVTPMWRDHRNSKQFYRDVVLVTPGGNLRYMEIIHVACDINNIKTAAKAGLMKADSEKIKTIVVPVTKDDSFLRDTNKFCVGILKAVNELATKLKCVQSVTIVIQRQQDFPFFNEVFEKESGICLTEKKTDTLFEKGKEKHATEPQAASLSSLEKVVPKAIIEMIRHPPASVSGTVPSSQKKTEVKEPVSPVITEADRSGEKETGPLKANIPAKEQHQNVPQYSSEEQYSFIVRGVQQEDARSLEEQIKPSGLATKFVYHCEVEEALVICKNSEDKNTLMNKLKQYKVQIVDPQKFQSHTAALCPPIKQSVKKVKKKQNPVDTVEQKSGVTISHTASTVQFKAVPLKEHEICAKETSDTKVQKRSENSISEDTENLEQIMNVTQSDFLALQSLEIYFDWTHKYNIIFTHEKETLYLQGALSDLSEERKKEIETEIATLRGKQKVELPYDPQEMMQFRSAIDEAKSDKLLLVWDYDNKQVLVYSDNYDDVQKFKHKVEFKMGKKKLTGRSVRRFANQEDTMPLLSEEKSPIEKTITQSFSSSQEATNVEVLRTSEGIVVKVYKANILKLGVDCIVNAANDNLQHGGGVALVIAKGAGPEIDREGSEILKIRGRIKVGEQCVTTAGNLPYKCIIHTVGPRWSDYYPHDARNGTRCETDLFNSIIGCFFEAENRNLKSIALPAISSGIFAVPRDMCTEQYVKAVIHYSETRTIQVLQEIHFIDMLPGIVQDMQLAFKRHLRCDGNSQHIAKSGGQTTAINDSAGRDSGNNQHGKMPEKDIGKTYPKDEVQTEEKQNPSTPLWPEIEQKYFKKEKFYIYKPNNKLEVNIYMADITKLTGVQAIVCSDDRRGTGLGAIASTLQKTGKSEFENIKKKAFQKEVNFGDVIITEGGDSNFQLVAHAVLPSFKDTISFERHKGMVHKCYDEILDEINKWQKTSLALPLLGAGCAELGYEGSAKLFLDSLEVFCNRTTTFNLKVIHIVDKDEHITEKIGDVFIRHTERVINHLLATHGRELKATSHPSSDTSSVRSQEEISQMKSKSPMSSEESKEECPLCLVKVKSLKTLSCSHTFCIKCMEKHFRTKPVCPKCGAFHGTIYGDQPEGGKMSISIKKQSLPGFEKNDTLRIEYQIPSGTQGPNHPKPRKPYSGIIKIAYLPDTIDGRKVCDLLKVAFERRLIFTFGRSSQGIDDVLMWSDIYHKTKFSGKHGYPDSGYLKRVQEQLAAKGVTEADLVQ